MDSKNFPFIILALAVGAGAFIYMRGKPAILNTQPATVQQGSGVSFVTQSELSSGLDELRSQIADELQNAPTCPPGQRWNVASGQCV